MYSVLSMKGVSNETVTSYYMDIIYDGIRSVTEAERFTFTNLPSKSNMVIVATVIDALRLYIKGYRKFGIWLQGILSAESYMKHQSQWRKWVLEWIEKWAIKKSTILFAVSDAMVEQYERKSHVKIKDKTFVMPCFNTSYQEESFSKESKERYQKRVFAYVGSLSPWQCFNETLLLYKKIEDYFGNTELRIFTPDIAAAESMAKQVDLQSYRVAYVDNAQLQNELRQVSYGFILRKNHIVNNVATPTKISSYMANGVIPIFGSSLYAFCEVSKQMKYALAHDCEKNDDAAVLEFCSMPINADELEQEYKAVFESYYSRQKYVSKIAEFIGGKANA